MNRNKMFGLVGALLLVACAISVTMCQMPRRPIDNPRISGTWTCANTSQQPHAFATAEVRSWAYDTVTLPMLGEVEVHGRFFERHDDHQTLHGVIDVYPDDMRQSLIMVSAIPDDPMNAIQSYFCWPGSVEDDLK